MLPRIVAGQQFTDSTDKEPGSGDIFNMRLHGETACISG